MNYAIKDNPILLFGDFYALSSYECKKNYGIELIKISDSNEHGNKWKRND